MLIFWELTWDTNLLLKPFLTVCAEILWLCKTSIVWAVRVAGVRLLYRWSWMWRSGPGVATLGLWLWGRVDVLYSMFLLRVYRTMISACLSWIRKWLLPDTEKTFYCAVITKWVLEEDINVETAGWWKYTNRQSSEVSENHMKWVMFVFTQANCFLSINSISYKTEEETERGFVDVCMPT